MPNAAEELGKFFDFIWRETDGLVYVPTLRQAIGSKPDIRQEMYKWPEHRSTVIQHVLKAAAEGVDAYASPVLYSQGPPTKENVKGSHVVWVELDGNAPENDKAFVEKNIPAPSLKIQTSVEKNQHVYWLLDHFETNVKKIEEINRSITYTMDADKSGWNVNHFLRPPMTTNQGIKRGERHRPAMPVLRVSEFGEAKSLEAFSSLPPAKQLVDESIELAENLRTLDQVIALNTFSEDLWTLFSATKDSLSDRSGALMRLAYTTAEQGFSDQDIFVLLENADRRWEKYTGRTDRNRQLLDILNRARLKVGYSFRDTSGIEEMLGLTEDQPVAKTKVVYNFMELLEADIHIDWLLDQFLPVGGLGVLASMPGIGKTQLGEQLAINIATGEDFLVWKNADKRPRKVLFLSLEMPAASLKYINEKIVKGYTPEQQDMLRENFYIATLGVPIGLDEAAGQQFLDSLMNTYQPELLIIDSLSQIVGEDLSDNKVIRRLTQYLSRSVQSKHNCAVLLIHHNRKSSGIIQQPSLDDLFGNTFLGAALDASLILRGHPDKSLIEVHPVKTRLGKLHDQFDVRRSDNLTFEVTSGSPFNSTRDLFTTGSAESTDGDGSTGFFGPNGISL